MENNIVGTQVGIYKVFGEHNERAKDGHKLYRVSCAYCGREFVFSLHDIKRASRCSHVGKYGYKKYSRVRNQRIKAIYNNMVDRCTLPTDKSFRFYGAKGISVCEEWHDYSIFESWALENGYADNLTIDRIDHFGNYSPDNCRWISHEENSRYKSTTNRINVDGTVKSGKEWARSLMVGENHINRYLRRNGIEKTVEYIKQRQSAIVPSIVP